jgi:hypothetical protein
LANSSGGVGKLMQLLPDCAPKSVMQILELVKLTYCSGCRFYRAEGRAKLWDSHGSHVPKVTDDSKLACCKSCILGSILKH